MCFLVNVVYHDAIYRILHLIFTNEKSLVTLQLKFHHLWRARSSRCFRFTLIRWDDWNRQLISAPVDWIQCLFFFSFTLLHPLILAILYRVLKRFVLFSWNVHISLSFWSRRNWMFSSLSSLDPKQYSPQAWREKCPEVWSSPPQTRLWRYPIRARILLWCLHIYQVCTLLMDFNVLSLRADPLVI